MKSSVKRLAKDQIGLRQHLPPNYFFESTDADGDATLPDDLTQLQIFLTGPEGTPYSQGIWHVRLNIPTDYPQSPPTATFQTRIFHPNVAEETGTVCLETLKRDWDPKLTLKDILITISCLLIQPNPDSALNQKAGALIQDDYDAFARQARLMTKIHAPIPQHLSRVAQEARRRGEEVEESVQQKSSHSFVPLGHTECTTKPVLRENQPSQNTDVIKSNEEKQPHKRSLVESTISADGSPYNDDLNERKRKSPRHNLHVKDASESVHDNYISKTSADTETSTTAPSVSLQYPDKVVFRARWRFLPGSSMAKARIGIRRL